MTAPLRDEYGRYTSTAPTTCPICNRVTETKSTIIEKGIPLPNNKRGEKSKLMGEMDPGDSILFNCSTQNLRNIAGRHVGKKFTIRTTDEGYRIWRIS